MATLTATAPDREAHLRIFYDRLAEIMKNWAERRLTKEEEEEGKERRIKGIYDWHQQVRRQFQSRCQPSLSNFGDGGHQVRTFWSTKSHYCTKLANLNYLTVTSSVCHVERKSIDLQLPFLKVSQTFWVHLHETDRGVT